MFWQRIEAGYIRIEIILGKNARFFRVKFLGP